MSAMNDSFLDDMHAELLALCKSDAVLSQVPILGERSGDITAEIEKSLGLLTSTAAQPAKLGACILLQQATADDETPAAPGGMLETQWTFVVMEDPTLNDGASGHQIRALKLARRLVRLLKLYRAEGLATTINTEKKGTITPVGVPLAPIAYQVRFRCTEGNPGVMQKVITPTIAPNVGAAPQAVTITCATAGVEIWYTLDGSHPWSGNPTAALYAAPVAVAAAGTLRARAFKTDYIGSNAAAGQYT